jgi:hypothetical protein
MSKERMIEKLRQAYYKASDVILIISELEDNILQNDDKKTQDTLAKLRKTVKDLIKNVKGEKNGYG